MEYTCKRCKTFNENMNENNKFCSGCGAQIGFSPKEIEAKKKIKLETAIVITGMYTITMSIFVASMSGLWIFGVIGILVAGYLYISKD